MPTACLHLSPLCSLLLFPNEHLKDVDYAHQLDLIFTHSPSLHGRRSFQGPQDLWWYTWWPHLSP